MRVTLLTAFSVIIIFSGCRDKKDPVPIEPEVFDKAGMLSNYADNRIIPDYRAFQSSLDSLITAYGTFTASGSVSDFAVLKTTFTSAYLNYQLISPYEFGPAEQAVVQMNFNVFPTDTGKIQKHINEGGYNLGAASALNAKGFPALDYLLFGRNRSESDLSQQLYNDTKRQMYVAELLQDMKERIAPVVSDWNGSYRGTFVASLGNDVGSSIGYMVNRINFELDYLKNAKIGIPLGKKTLGDTLPKHCESLYAGNSKVHAERTLDAIEAMYRGTSRSGTNGLGFDDYLNHLGSQHVNESLTAAIDRQFGVCRQKFAAVGVRFETEISSNKAAMESLYTELVKLLVLLKTDMPSALGVAITYQDGDGD